MASSYYIYYKVSPAQAQTLRAAVEELQRGIASKIGIQGRLLRRGDQSGTWMEVYEDVGDTAAFERAMSAELERVRFDGAGRHTEIFEPF